MRQAVLAGVLALAPSCAGAEVKFAAPDGFLIEHRFTIAAPAAQVWETLLHPERWWPADHTWSGKRENLSLVADAGGCFCERWDGGSVEHGRVVAVFPGKMLRLDAALGPLQEMAWVCPGFPDTEIRWEDDLGGVRWADGDSRPSSSSRRSSW
ncbi:MAG: hypothetical protein FJ171_11530 [Gammaproteobacteria bacterium]|nr:hypothetical protein [Gammaproteobacteria bacterium]